MTELSVPRIRPWIFGLASLGLTFAGWIFFVFSFTATAAAWWNSLHFFALVYIASLALALRGIRSAVGILALILSALSLGLVSLFIFG